jgi:hypothetical protein
MEAPALQAKDTLAARAAHHCILAAVVAERMPLAQMQLRPDWGGMVETGLHLP